MKMIRHAVLLYDVQADSSIRFRNENFFNIERPYP